MGMFTGTFGTPEALLLLGLIAVALPLVYLADRLRVEIDGAIRRSRQARHMVPRTVVDVEPVRSTPFIDPMPTVVVATLPPVEAPPVTVDPVHVGATEGWSPLAEVEATTVLSSPMDDTDLFVAFDLRLREIERRCGAGEALEAFVQDSMRLPAYRALRLERTGEIPAAELRAVLGAGPIPIRRPLAPTAA